MEGIVRARLNVLISGGTGSGKTTLLNVLSGFIPSDERIVSIEDSAELQLKQRYVVRLETRPANTEGKGEVIARDLVKNSPPDAAGPDCCRRGKRGGSFRHAAGDEHRARRFSFHDSRELSSRRPGPPGNARSHVRAHHPPRGRQKADQFCYRYHYSGISPRRRQPKIGQSSGNRRHGRQCGYHDGDVLLRANGGDGGGEGQRPISAERHQT